MTSLTSYERQDSFKTTVTFKSGSVNIDPSGNLAFIDIRNPDGSLYISDSGVKISTGNYYYWISTLGTNDLGIYSIDWWGNFWKDSTFGYMPRHEKECVIIEKVVQS